MKRLTSEELNEVLENHKHWLNEDVDGWEDMQAILCGANLYRANLIEANLIKADLCRANLIEADLIKADLCRANLIEAILYGANLYRANLIEADLIKADLCRANLIEADLSYASLSGADLYNSNLCHTNLSYANLSGADLYNSNLCHTNLSYANLSYANLSGADLGGADLCGANLYRANLYGADLRDAKNVPFIPIACPEVGEFIGFKKAHSFIVVLKILEDSRRLSATTRKCRCDKALVMEIQYLDGTKADVEEVSSNHDGNFVYRVGEIVSVDNFDEDRWNECSTGIHFFINRQEAVDY